MVNEELLISNRQRIEQSNFFAMLDSFGFFDAVSEHLPDNFTAIYEIARIIESTDTLLGEQLAPVMMMASSSESIAPPVPEHIPTILPAEEYDADLIRNVQELPAIYPYQFLLPENVFYQRLVERSLWLPRPRPPQNYRYQSESDTFKPDHRKQKVYLLFDVSKSMNVRWRIHLAKAIAYIFLQKNMKELGTVYFREFADTIGDLITAKDIPSFNELISHIMHVKALGKGTALQRALTAAIEDITSLNSLSDAEILVITDGAAHIEIQKIRDMLGATIKINTVKIGDERINADAKFVQYHLNDANTEDAKRLKQLINKRHDVALHMDNLGTGVRKTHLQDEISMLDKQISTLTERVAKYINAHYGMEIIELSSVYVNVPDIIKSEFLTLSDEQRAELEELTDSLMQELRLEHRADDIKRAALLYDHLELLLKHNPSNEMEKLSEQKKELEELFKRIMMTDGDDDIDDIHLTAFDTKQLRNMLEPSVNQSPLAFARVLKALLRKIKNWIAQRRQVRRAKIVLSRRNKK